MLSYVLQCFFFLFGNERCQSNFFFSLLDNKHFFFKYRSCLLDVFLLSFDGVFHVFFCLKSSFALIFLRQKYLNFRSIFVFFSRMHFFKCSF